MVSPKAEIKTEIYKTIETKVDELARRVHEIETENQIIRIEIEYLESVLNEHISHS